MLHTLTENWSNSYKSQMKFIDLELREFFIFVKKEVLSFKELIETYEETKSEFIRNENNLLSKKEEYFNTANLNKWEIDESIDRSEIISNKEIAFSKMLPKVFLDKLGNKFIERFEEAIWISFIYSHNRI
jgi:hypothetical protein